MPTKLISAKPFALPGLVTPGLVAVLCALLLTACGGPVVRKSQPVEPLQQARTELPPEDVLGVNIAVFDYVVPRDDNYPGVESVYRDIRDAESRYVPYSLRRTLEQSGHWGDVRVTPKALPAAQLKITGRILESHGEELRLQVKAQDASQRVWLDQVYSGYASEDRYDGRLIPEIDPFQGIYNEIANDLVAARARLDAEDKLEIQQIAEMRFAADLAPAAYEQYLTEKRGRIRLDGLPPAGDPLLARIDLAAQRDALLVDRLDQHYRDFHLRMETPYTDWRQASFNEIRNLRELQREANARKALGVLAIIGGIIGVAKSDSNLGSFASQLAVAGGIYALSSGIDKSSQTGLHVESLRELARSLQADLEPEVLELQDRTVRLSGSAEEQYAQWRDILDQMIQLDAAPETNAAADVTVVTEGVE